MPNVLSIAGSDPSGGAGIQADLKTFAALGVYGCTAVTALTAQNTRGVSAVLATPAEFISRQLDAVFADVEIRAVKIGMLPCEAAVHAVSDALRKYGARQVVLDPVARASTGARMTDDEGLAALRRELLPLATVVTPNAEEAGLLAGGPPPTTTAEAGDAARALHALGPAYVLVTGGHIEGGVCVDILFDGERVVSFASPRIDVADTHGTGCTLSSAIAAFLARGHDVPAACAAAQRFVGKAIEASGMLAVGGGVRPVHQMNVG
jgi:hydroxymethylpyrimidine/phosphomethylpyrimidine kinase